MKQEPRQLGLDVSHGVSADGLPFSAETEPSAQASPKPIGSDLMAKVCEHQNLQDACKRVKRNKGSPGVDGMTVDELDTYLREHGPDLAAALLAGRYIPQPIRAVSIAKPDGGERILGIPTVVAERQLESTADDN